MGSVLAAGWWRATALWLSMSCGCAPPGPAAPAPTALGAAEVVRLEGRPALRSLVRDGDPAPAVAIAVATDLGGIATAALAAVLEGRLGARGFPTTVTSDGVGLHIVWFPARPDLVAGLVDALQDAYARPLSPDDDSVLDAVRQRIRGSSAPSLDSPALAPIGRCRGLPLVTADDARLITSTNDQLARAVDIWRQRALTAERTALGTVGGREIVQATASALATAAAPWPRADPSDTQASSQTAARPVRAVATYGTASIAAGQARLDLVFYVERAFDALIRARAFAASNAPPRVAWPRWSAGLHLASARATALPQGGCVHLSFASEEALAEDELASAAARLVVAVERELRSPLGNGGESARAEARAGAFFLPDVREAASVAAWWEACGQTDDRQEQLEGAATLEAVLGVSQLGADPLSSDTLRQAIEARLATQGGAPNVEVRSATENGQAELWLLAAPPCSLAQEGPADGGLLSLAAMAAGRAARGDVALEAWISAEAVGLLAHATSRPGESAAEWARRVAAALGGAVAKGSTSSPSLQEVRTQLVVAGTEASARSTRALTELLLPQHPSWLLPLPAPDIAARADRDTLEGRWRSAWRGHVRLAILTPVGEEQVTAAQKELSRWLESEGAGQCAAEGLRRPPPGLHVDHDLSSAVVLAGTLLSPGREREAEILRAWLADPLGPLRQLGERARVRGWDVHRLGASRAAALLIEVRARTGTVDESRAVLGEILDGIDDLAAAAPFADLVRAADARSLARATDPRARIADIWTAEQRSSVPTELDWRAFVREALATQALVWLVSP